MSGTDTAALDAWVVRVLGVQPGVASSEPPVDAPKSVAPGFVQMQKARLAWDAARKRVAAEIDAFRLAVATDFEGDESEDEVLDGLDELDDITLNFDDRIIDTLDLLLDERTGEQERPALLDEAKALLAEYEAFASSSAMFKALNGSTPFGVTLAVQSTMTEALAALRAALR